MAGRELLDADDLLAAAGEMVKRRAAHGAEPDHRYVHRRHLFMVLLFLTLS
jgi:hypothetical protein